MRPRAPPTCEFVALTKKDVQVRPPFFCTAAGGSFDSFSLLPVTHITL